MLQCKTFVELFTTFGIDWKLSGNTGERIESFVCQMYGKNVIHVNELYKACFNLENIKLMKKHASSMRMNIVFFFILRGKIIY